MKKHSLIKLAGLVVAAALAFTGCGSGGSDGAVLGGNGSTVTGGGGTTTTTGTTGFGVTGGSLTGAFGGTGGSSGTGGITGGITGGTGGNTGGSTGGNGFLGNVTPLTLGTGLDNPTAFTFLDIGGTEVQVFATGYRNLATAGSGRLRAVLEDGVTIVDITDRNTASPVSFSSPFDILYYNNRTPNTPADDAIFMTVGFAAGVGQGAVIRVDNFSLVNNQIVADFEILPVPTGAAPPVNPSFMVGVSIGANDYVYFSESNTQPNGTIRRVNVNGSGNGDGIIFTGLAIPTGIATNGSQLIICEGNGGVAGLVYAADLQTNAPAPGSAPGPNTPNTPLREVIPTGDAETNINRPFMVVHDGENGFFLASGAVFPGTPALAGGFTSVGAANGRIRFISNASAATTTPEAQLVVGGLNNAACIDASDANDDGTAAVLFSDSLSGQGRVMRLLVNTNNIVPTNTPSVVQSDSTNVPFFVLIGNENLPVLLAMFNPFDSQQGIFRAYQP